MKSVKKANGFFYVEALPDGYSSDEKLPVIVHYHGHGWAKKNINDFAVDYSVLSDIEKFATQKRFAAVLPLCPEESWFDCFSELKEFTLSASRMTLCDKSRVYMSGISMGGCAAWQMLCTLNNVFAAGVICCGIAPYWDARIRLKAPVRAFHGEDDKVIYPEETKRAAEEINAAGGSVKTTFYPKTAHNCWSETYKNAEVYDWLLEHRKEELI